MRAALMSLAFLAVAGCKVKNPNFCEPSDGVSCPDGGVDAPEKCSTSDPCDTGVCKDPPGICVECLTNAECTSAAEPACNATTNTCEKCTAHSQCASNACLPDGSCADESQVAYVKNSGAGTTCTKEAPCAEVNVALAVAPPKSYIRIEGTVVGTGTISITNRNVTMLGDPKTSVLQRTGSDVIAVDGTSVVKLYDLTISNAVGNTGISGTSAHTGTLEIQRCKITNNSLGIDYAGSGTFILSRSTVDENVLTGGVRATGAGAKLDITNNFIVRNGNDSNGVVGGISLTNALPGMSRVEFNTIVQNRNTDANGKAGGIYCDLSTTFVMANNIIAGNVAPMPSRAQNNGDCQPTGSLVQADLTGLVFVKSTSSPYDYHLAPGTTGGINTATGTLAIDIDGEKRPNGPAPDMGADELY